MLGSTRHLLSMGLPTRSGRPSCDLHVSHHTKSTKNAIHKPSLIKNKFSVARSIEIAKCNSKNQTKLVNSASTGYLFTSSPHYRMYHASCKSSKSSKEPRKVKGEKVPKIDDRVLADLEDLGDMEFPDLEPKYDPKDIPDIARGPMKEIKLPKKKHVFNYKTYRYKDLSSDDFSRITKSFTIPATSGPQVRPGESMEPIIHTKDNPGEDLSTNEIPPGLESSPIPYNRQIMRAIYDVLVQEKGEDIVVIDIEKKTNWVPTMLIVTAMSARHCVAIAHRVQAELKRLKLCKNAKVDRNEGDEWVIVSTGVAIVEIMTQESRDYMDLERLWVLKKSAQETFEFDEEEERFMYDEEDGMWDDDDPDW